MNPIAMVWILLSWMPNLYAAFFFGILDDLEQRQGGGEGAGGEDGGSSGNGRGGGRDGGRAEEGQEEEGEEEEGEEEEGEEEEEVVEEAESERDWLPGAIDALAMDTGRQPALNQIEERRDFAWDVEKRAILRRTAPTKLDAFCAVLKMHATMLLGQANAEFSDRPLRKQEQSTSVV
ncbi:hypothetical protein Trydic_g247 [Trypoxylus dichotomus]